MSEPPLPAPQPPRLGARLLARCAAAARWPRRRPRRALAALFLLGLLALGGWQLRRVCLAEYHLRAARRAVERGHNLRAQHHLERCLARRPREPEAMLLAARVARRVGAFDAAENWL